MPSRSSGSGAGVSSRGRAGGPWPAQTGELGRLIAAHPWSRTPLGPLEAWPARLRWAVDLLLRAGGPMAVVWGPEHRFLYNDAYGAILRDKHPAALGAPAAEIFPESWPSIRPLMEAAMRGQAVELDDFSLQLDREGRLETAFFSGSYNPLENEAGEVDGFLAVVVETTARVARERERARTFDTTLSAIADFAYSFDRAGRFLYVNKALLDLWGLRLEQAVGKNFFDLGYPPALAERLQRQIEEVFQRGQVLRDETPYVSPAGVTGYYEYIFSPVRGDDGEVSVVAGSTREISARKRLERDLREAQTRMESALAAGEIGTWTWDVGSDRVVADRNLARLFSVTPEEAAAGPLDSYLRAIHPDDLDRVQAAVRAALEDGEHFRAEYRLVDPAGRMRWVIARGSVERDADGRAVSLPGVVLDITERKRLEQRLEETVADLKDTQSQLEAQAGALESLVAERTSRLRETVAELESFSYSVSHDLRGPLRVMQSFAEALREDCEGEVGALGRDYIRRIVAAAERMDRIIQDVLVHGRLARAEPAPERVELAEFVPSLLDGYPHIHDTGADIVIEGALPAVWASQAALTQCLANLIAAAVRSAAPCALPRVRVSARVVDGRARLSVRDNGAGGRPDAASEQAAVGLVIARKAAERLGGRIFSESLPDGGNIRTLDLALAAEPHG